MLHQLHRLDSHKKTPKQDAEAVKTAFLAMMRKKLAFLKYLLVVALVDGKRKIWLC